MGRAEVLGLEWDGNGAPVLFSRIRIWLLGMLSEAASSVRDGMVITFGQPQVPEEADFVVLLIASQSTRRMKRC